MLLDELRQRILILDGAQGTMIQQYPLDEEDFRGKAFAGCPKELKGNNECLNITRPDILLDIHRAYIRAGADIITTNSFSANSISQAEYGLAGSAALMAREAARLARTAADEAASGASPRKVWVAGSVGPTGKSLSLASDISDPDFRLYDFDAMYEAYRQQIAALLEGGADIILLETCFDALNTKAALAAISDLGTEAPVMVSVSVGDRSGRTLTGQTLEAFYHSVKHANLLSFGLNCSLGAKELEPLIADVSAFAQCRVSCHPNAGLPDEMGRYNDSPQSMAGAVLRMAQNGCLNIAGGCCGTTPQHIEAIAQALKGIAPRALPQTDNILRVSGLEAVSIDRRNNFTNIGERTNVAGSRKFAKLIAAGEYDTALQIAAEQIENGAGIIDVNMDDAMLDSRVQMRKFLRCISNDPAVAKAALMIDSSHWETIVDGLKNAQGKCIVNSISLKEGEEAMIEKARFIKKMGAAVVVMAFDEEGQATTHERKIEICRRAYDILTLKVGMLPQDIIFDVNVLSVATGIAEHRRYGTDFIEAVRWIKGNLPHALCSGGISNLSFAFRGNNPVREAMHSAFLYHAGKAGLDMGIVNPGMLQIYDQIEPDMLRKVEDVILDRSDDATDALIEKAQQIAEAAARGSASASASKASTGVTASSAEERIINALIKGASATLSNDIMDCLGRYGKAVDVIEGPLMDGMRKVGEYFGQGKMFLPQVVKSAKTMRDAVEILKPYMDAEGSNEASAKPRIVIATVKGDVHDIGKNITAIVLGCNGFEVTDLGVMVPKETILEAAEQHKADIIAVSGLITPSLFQMEELCREMARRAMSTPLFIGGATTSAVHTAVKLAPLYNHVYYGPDASASAVLCKSYLANPQAFEDEQHALQEQLRQQYNAAEAKADGRASSAGAGSNDSADGKALGRFPAESFIRGNIFSNIPSGEIPAEKVLPYFDWRMFNAVWGVKEDALLQSDAKAAMDKLAEHGHLHIKMALQFHQAHSSGNSIILANGTSIPMLRQEQAQGLSLADFLPHESLGFDSPIGFMMIAVTSDGDCPCCKAEYDSMMLRAIKVCLAEAASEYVSDRLAGELAGTSADIPEGVRIIKPAAGYASCPDHSLKRDIMAAIPSAEKLGISFTETYAMVPEASISAFVFAHPEACYPEIRRISSSAIEAYAQQRGFSAHETDTFLGHLKK